MASPVVNFHVAKLIDCSPAVCVNFPEAAMILASEDNVKSNSSRLRVRFASMFRRSVL